MRSSLIGTLEIKNLHFLNNLKVFEPQRPEMYLQTCSHSEDSDQPAHSRSLIRIFTGRMRTTKTDQTARMRRLI